MLVAFIITATFGALLWGLYQGTQAVLRGDISAGHLGQTVVYVIILVVAAWRCCPRSTATCCAPPAPPSG